jgi:hypothetical protein
VAIRADGDEIPLRINSISASQLRELLHMMHLNKSLSQFPVYDFKIETAYRAVYSMMLNAGCSGLSISLVAVDLNSKDGTLWVSVS